jgi:hypothetical protein
MRRHEGLVLKTIAWCDNAVSSCRSCSRAKGPGTSVGAFPTTLSLPEGIQAVLDGVRRGPVGPPGPLESAALARAGGGSARPAASAPGLPPRRAPGRAPARLERARARWPAGTGRCAGLPSGTAPGLFGTRWTRRHRSRSAPSVQSILLYMLAHTTNSPYKTSI